MNISRWISESPSVVEAYDTTRPDFEAHVDEIDAWYQRRPAMYSELDEMGRREGEAALAFRIALKIVESRRIVSELNAPFTITLLNPVYKETGRMQRREDHRPAQYQTGRSADGWPFLTRSVICARVKRPVPARENGVTGQGRRPFAGTPRQEG